MPFGKRPRRKIAEMSKAERRKLAEAREARRRQKEALAHHDSQFETEIQIEFTSQQQHHHHDHDYCVATSTSTAKAIYTVVEQPAISKLKETHSKADVAVETCKSIEL